MSLMNFTRVGKTQLTESQLDDMNRCYDLFLKRKLIHSSKVDTLEKRFKQTSNPSSICGLEFDLDFQKFQLGIYKDFLSFIDNKLQTENDLKMVLDFVEKGGLE